MLLVLDVKNHLKMKLRKPGKNIVPNPEISKHIKINEQSFIDSDVEYQEPRTKMKIQKVIGSYIDYKT